MHSVAQMLEQAVQHHRAGRLHPAELLYRQILQIDPRHADALHLLGLIAHQVGSDDLAVATIQQALRLRPQFPAAYNNLGLALRNQGKLDEAIASYREALRLKPDFTEAHNNLGNALRDQGKLEEALATFQQALQRRPDSAETYNNLGTVLRDQGKLDEALASYREALRLKPQYAQAHNNVGIALQDQGRLDEAIFHYRESLHINSDYAEAHNNLGVALKEQGRFDEAIAHHRESLRVKPDYAEAHNNLGNVLREKGQREEAITWYREALRRRPDYVEAYNNLGIVLGEEGRLEEAVVSYREALARKRDFAEAHVNLGLALHDLGKLDEAIASHRQVLRLEPDHGDAHFRLSLLLLQQGNFAEGWVEYDWRWRSKVFQVKGSPKAAQPRMDWDGSPLEGRSILLHAEQGLGDTIQFVRYAALLKQQGAGRVVLACPAALQRLMERCPEIDQVVCKSPYPPSDVGTVLQSLPRLLGTTSVERIPAKVPYLECDPELVERWQARLAAQVGQSPALRVGIVWQGNPSHVGDRWRSVGLEQFAPLADVAGVRLVSLQKGAGSEQLARMPSLAVDPGPELTDLADTAAVIRCLDLVIAVDTAVAHLAGSMGAPVWVALPAAPDWRWLLQREDSPWYPSMRLFRQAARGQWDEAFSRIKTALAAYSSER